MTAGRDDVWVDMTQFDPRLADRVWEGDLRDPDAPPWYADVAAAIRRARGPAEPGELIDEPVVVASMSRAALGHRVNVRHRRQRSTALPRLVAMKATATVASATMVGVAAATTGLVAGVVVPAINEHVVPMVGEHLVPEVTVPGSASVPSTPRSTCAGAGTPCGDRVPLPVVDDLTSEPRPVLPSTPPAPDPAAHVVPGSAAAHVTPAAPVVVAAVTDDPVASRAVEVGPPADATISPVAERPQATPPPPGPGTETVGPMAAPARPPSPEPPPTAQAPPTPPSPELPPTAQAPPTRPGPERPSSEHVSPPTEHQPPATPTGPASRPTDHAQPPPTGHPSPATAPDSELPARPQPASNASSPALPAPAHSSTKGTDPAASPPDVAPAAAGDPVLPGAAGTAERATDAGAAAGGSDHPGASTPHGRGHGPASGSGG